MPGFSARLNFFKSSQFSSRYPQALAKGELLREAASLHGDEGYVLLAPRNSWVLRLSFPQKSLHGLYLRSSSFSDPDLFAESKTFAGSQL